MYRGRRKSSRGDAIETMLLLQHLSKIEETGIRQPGVTDEAVQLMVYCRVRIERLIERRRFVGVDLRKQRYLEIGEKLAGIFFPRGMKSSRTEFEIENEK